MRKPIRKILLLQPPVRDFYETDIRLQPIGLAYLKATVQKHLPEIQVTVRDFHHGYGRRACAGTQQESIQRPADKRRGNGRRTLPLPKELDYLRDFYAWPDKSPFSTFYSFYHFGAEFEDLAREVAEAAPDLVGISSLFSPYSREVLACARAIKNILEVPILVGGSHASVCPERLLEDPNVDFVIRGEGERPLVEFLRTWNGGGDLAKVSNLGYRSEGQEPQNPGVPAALCSLRHCERPRLRGSEAIPGCEIASALSGTPPRNDEEKRVPHQIILNPVAENFPLDDIPFPDFSDFSPGDYLFEGKPLAFIVASRGCPYRCSFCSAHQTFGRHYRLRDIESILEEMKLRYAQGFRAFDFEDDNLTLDQEKIKTLCRRISETFPDRDIRLMAMNGLSYQNLDSELLELMRFAGFTHLNLSLVSSNESVLGAAARPHTLEKYLEVVREGSRLGFEMVSYQILGLPGENLESMIRTMAMNAALPVLLGASIFYLTPGTDIAKAFPAMTEEDIFKSRLTAMAGAPVPAPNRNPLTVPSQSDGAIAIETDLFKREDLYTLFVTARILNFLKSLEFLGETIGIDEVLIAAETRDERSKTGAELLRRLLSGGGLFAATSEGFKPLTCFKSELFFRVWSSLESVRTQRGKSIKIQTSSF